MTRTVTLCKRFARLGVDWLTEREPIFARTSNLPSSREVTTTNVWTNLFNANHGQFKTPIITFASKQKKPTWTKCVPQTFCKTMATTTSTCCCCRCFELIEHWNASDEWIHNQATSTNYNILLFLTYFALNRYLCERKKRTARVACQWVSN